MSPRSDGNSCTWRENQNTIKGFYEKNIRNRSCYVSTLDDIGLWIDSKNNEILDSNAE